MAVTGDEFILWGAVIGLLIGIVWGMRYVVRLERRIITLDKSIKRAIRKK